MKKGFTLIELLAVIIILAILMIIAVPNILSTLATARQQAFVTQAQSIYKAAEQQYTISSMKNEYHSCFGKGATNAELDLGSISSSLNYYVAFNSNGQITAIQVYDSGQSLAISLPASGTSVVPQNAINSAAVTTGSISVTQCVANAQP